MPKRKISFTLILVVLILVAGIGGIWYWNANKKKILRQELENAIEKKSQGLYKVEYANMELDEVNGNLSVSSFRISHDSIMYLRLRQQGKSPFLLFKITIPEIRISGVKTPRALLQNEIKGRHVLISRPVIEILYTNSGKDSVLNVPTAEIYKQILGGLEFIKLDSVIISNAEIITRNLQSGKTLVRFLNTTISLYDLSIDSTSEADTTRLLYAREVNLDCQKFTWQSADKRYNYQVDSISFRSASSDVSIDKFFIIPNLNEAAFAKSVPYQTDRFDIALRNIRLRNTDFYSLFNEVIKADTLSIGSASFKIYRDRSRPEEKKSRVGNYPHQALQRVPVQLNIKKAIVRNSVVEYRERNPVTGKTGKVLFPGTSAVISNITNMKERIRENNQMVLETRGNFVDKVPLSTKWTFYLGSGNGKFAISGELGAADARKYNVLAEPLGPASFKSGRVHSLAFNFNGNDHQASGRVKLLYEKLKVNLLEQREKNGEFNKRTISSLFANMKIKNDNPDDDGGEPRIADVTLQRDKYRSIFNLAWKTVFEGVKEITNAKR